MGSYSTCFSYHRGGTLVGFVTVYKAWPQCDFLRQKSSTLPVFGSSLDGNATSECISDWWLRYPYSAWKTSRSPSLNLWYVSMIGFKIQSVQHISRGGLRVRFADGCPVSSSDGPDNGGPLLGVELGLLQEGARR